MKLDGKIALITGAAGGIGLATARAFGREGARVAVVDHHADAGARAEALLRDTGTDAHFILADVRAEEDMRRVVATTEARWGGLDILFCNAGIDLKGSIEDVPPPDFDRAFAVNVRGPYLASRLAIPIMRARGGGVILMNASNAGLVARAQDPIYCAAKAAVIMLARSMALSLAADRIRVNAICPGPVDTPLLWEAHPQADRDALTHGLLASVPLGRALGRVASADEVAAAAVYLASDDAAYITGIALPVDGGKTAGLQVF